MMGELIVGGTKAAGNAAIVKKADTDEKKLRNACADFEAIFIYQLMQSMRKTVPRGGFLPLSAGRSTWEMVMDQHLAEAISRRGDGLGLQKILYEELKKKLKNSQTQPIKDIKE
jgi:flagellar protein FlgJ